MSGNLDQLEPLMRFGSFALIFLLMATLELVEPRRSLNGSKSRRWITNLGILGASTLLARLMGSFAVPLVAVGMAAIATTNGWGLFNFIELPLALEIILAIMLLDGAIWLQHVISHKVPFFWRMHRVHHADRDIDVTTALRFHPFEIALSMAYKTGIVVALGPAIWAVILFEILLNGSAMFNHANVQLPQWLDRTLRLVIVTPDMHRVHHSVHRDEHDTNYGFCLSIWDRLFRTYTDLPRDGHEAMKIGLDDYPDDSPDGFLWTLKLPLESSGKSLRSLQESVSDNA
ncbi:MAG: sterol desaturase family protein [Pseudomonadota bacterium]